METLGEAFPKELARARELLGEYEAIGPAGIFGAALIKQVIQRADQAAVSGDLVSMIRSYQELKGLK